MKHCIASFTLVTALAASSVACSSDPSNVDPGTTPEAGIEAGTDTDSGDSTPRDAGLDSGRDAGRDSGSDGGTDAGPFCTKPEDCPALTSECVERTCKGGVCGQAPKAVGTTTATQTAGDCKRAQCDGAGNVVGVNDDTDVPVDTNDCTNDVCTAGVPTNPLKAVGTACGAGNALKCDATGACVGCIVAADCAGDDTDCSKRTCTTGMCGRQSTPAGVAVTAQITGDCKKVVCDGAGATTSQNDDADVASDGNACTNDVCSGGVPSHPNVANGTVCAAGKGCFDGACTGCAVAADCAGGDDDCKRRTCTAGECGHAYSPAGTATTAQIANDCKRAECDGAGNIVQANADDDVPTDDGSQCTNEICTGGVGAHANAVAGTVCNQNGGTFCDGAGVCVAPSCTDGIKNGTETGIDCGGSCPACPAEVIVVPSDGDTNVSLSTAITITFASPRNPATLTAQATAGVCSESLQVSSDNFATCIGFAAPVVAVGDTEITLTPTPALAYGTTYKARITTAVTSAGGVAFAGYTMPAGFSTVADTSCPGSAVVISQIYGGGGSSGAPFKNDFIELHNRSNATVNLTGWSVQYASATGAFNGVENLSGSIPAGGYYLIQAASTGAAGAALPTPDLTTTSINLAQAAGKVALVSATTGLTACNAATALDVIGYGTTANCSEGTRAPAPSVANADIRKGDGCQDTNDNSADFVAAAPTPRNSSSPALVCVCARP